MPGDSFNRIHWRSSAKRGQLIVKEFEIDPLVDIWLFVDFSTQSLVEDSSIQRIGQTGPIISVSQGLPPSTEEYGVVIAASLAKYFVNQERALGYAAYNPNREIFQPERGNRQLTRIYQSLAVSRSLAPFALKEMLSLETHSFTRGTTLIIVTSSLDEAWVTEAQILQRRGIRPMCIFVDPQSFGRPESSEVIRGMLQLANIPTIQVKRNDNLTAALAQRPATARQSAFNGFG